MQPLGKHGRGSPSVERFVGATTNVSETEERIDGDDHDVGGSTKAVGDTFMRGAVKASVHQNA